MTLLLYGVVRAEHRIPAFGKDDDGPPPLTVVEEDGLWAVGREVPDDFEITEEDAVDHLDVLVLLVRTGPVLPLRFGTVAPDADSVRSELLRPALNDLHAGLEIVRDDVELRIDLAFDEDVGIKAVYEADPELRQLAAATHEGAPSLDTRIELGQVTSERLEGRRAQVVEIWMKRLAHLVERSAVLPPPAENTERIALLVRREQVYDVDAVVLALREEYSREIEADYVGPLPVFTFADRLGEPAEQAESRWGW